MEHCKIPIQRIRPAAEADAGRIAEMIVTNYRMNFYPFFRNDQFYFNELNVLDTAKEYAAGSSALQNSYVYDDGVVKGVIHISGTKIEKLYVEPQFQGQGIGAALLQYAVQKRHTVSLWVLEYIRQYRTKSVWRLCTPSACKFPVIFHKNAREYIKYSLRFLFHLTKNLTTHLSHNLCAVLP